MEIDYFFFPLHVAAGALSLAQGHTTHRQLGHLLMFRSTAPATRWGKQKPTASSCVTGNCMSDLRLYDLRSIQLLDRTQACSGNGLPLRFSEQREDISQNLLNLKIELVFKSTLGCPWGTKTCCMHSSVESDTACLVTTYFSQQKLPVGFK